MTLLLIASAKVLPSVLLPSYELAAALRQAGQPVVSGFHTPLERECLSILLRGSQPVTIVPARSMGENDRLYNGALWAAVKAGLAEGRVTITPPPGMNGNRITSANAQVRNRYLLELADRILVLYATPAGETERLVQEAAQRGIPVLCLDHPATKRLRELGARPVTPATVAEVLREIGIGARS